MWQALHEELGGLGLTVITIALDEDPEAARPWIEAASPTHPSLVDTQWRFADLYGVVNVPTVVWVDERGHIVRPNDTVYVTDAYVQVHGIRPEPHLERIRRWVRDGTGALDDEEVRRLSAPPDDTHQLARAHFGLGQWLHRNGWGDRAEHHFTRAGELAPHDFTIRRGSMRMRGQDPAGPEFRAMVADWVGQGRPYYETLPDHAG